MLNNYHEILKKADIRPSIQRIAIYTYLCEHPIHPDVETVYNDLYPIYPTLSKTTVYNTLKLFEEKGIVQFIKIEDDKIRFDAEMRDHIHFKCNICGMIYDLFDDKKNESIKKESLSLLPQNFDFSKMQFYMWGTCANCNKK